MNQVDLISLTTVIGMGLGWLLKNKVAWKDAISRKAIPAILLVVAALKNVGIASGVFPPEATVLGALGVPDTGGIALAAFWGPFGAILINSVIDQALPVGLHSSVKNLIEYWTGRARTPKRK